MHGPNGTANRRTAENKHGEPKSSRSAGSGAGRLDTASVGDMFYSVSSHIEKT